MYVDIDKNKKKIINVILIISISFFISVPFMIIYNYFIILLIVISIPFKFVPLKYYLGIVYDDI